MLRGTATLPRCLVGLDGTLGTHHFRHSHGWHWVIARARRFLWQSYLETVLGSRWVALSS